jgi:hypothetical protein
MVEGERSERAASVCGVGVVAGDQSVVVTSLDLGTISGRGADRRVDVDVDDGVSCGVLVGELGDPFRRNSGIQGCPVLDLPRDYTDTDRVVSSDRLTPEAGQMPASATGSVSST